MALIKRDLIKKVESMMPEQFHRFIIAVCGAYLRQDAAPVVHGRWIHDINNLYGCSECIKRETMSPKKLKPYCPNCGCKMDGGEGHGL